MLTPQISCRGQQEEMPGLDTIYLSVDWGWGKLMHTLMDYEKGRADFPGENQGAINVRKRNGSQNKTTEELYNFLIISSHNLKHNNLVKFCNFYSINGENVYLKKWCHK